MPRRHTSIVVAVCGVVLVVCCILWALLVQKIGPDVCSRRPIPPRAGPVSCHHSPSTATTPAPTARGNGNTENDRADH